ncbi:hypothetical protein IW261DRAFT_1567429 [Armillaria novae-zelandiae]|uniref:Uncharacterized protein n=1 Tax=Armillaria novae-zelandiae TaxID=153914 RepID=A0AA39U2G7_9AGAR|nr:hypothetical protein IW261DRAFT_1567429 [Armillaria novae-zelandiae]
MSSDASEHLDLSNHGFPADPHSATYSATTKKTLSQESVSDHSYSSIHSTALSSEDLTPNSKVHFTSNYDRYIQVDLENRVFIPADDFFTKILHLPQDWRANDEI